MQTFHCPHFLTFIKISKIGIRMRIYNFIYSLKLNKMKKNYVLSCSLIIMLSFTANLFSQDWPQFRGIGRDSKVTGFKAPSVWPAELTQQWKVTVGTGDATPLLAGKKLYLHTRQGGDEVVLCLDAATGKELWKDSYTVEAVTGPSASHPGPRSTPAIADGKIVTFGTSGITFLPRCFHRKSSLEKRKSRSCHSPVFHRHVTTDCRWNLPGSCWNKR